MTREKETPSIIYGAELKDWGDKHGKKTEKTREMIVGTTQPPKAS